MVCDTIYIYIHKGYDMVYDTILWYIMVCYTILWQIMVCYTILGSIKLYYGMFYYMMVYYGRRLTRRDCLITGRHRFQDVICYGGMRFWRAFWYCGKPEFLGLWNTSLRVQGLK